VAAAVASLADRLNAEGEELDRMTAAFDLQSDA
jgi:hypothetical protein